MSWRTAENLRRMGGTAEYSFTESDSSPMELEREGTGLAMANNDLGATLIVKVYRKTGDITFRLKNTLNILISPFRKIEIIQATLSFDIIVFSPEGEKNVGV